MAGSWATDTKLADHFAGYGRREGRVAQRLRVVLSYDAAALVEDDAAPAHGRVSNQLYSLIGTMAIALQLGAEMVRVGARVNGLYSVENTKAVKDFQSCGLFLFRMIIHSYSYNSFNAL